MNKLAILWGIFAFLTTGTVSSLMWMGCWYVASRCDKDPTAGGAYAALSMITAPCVFLGAGAVGAYFWR